MGEIISAVSSVIVALLVFYMERRQKRSDDATKQHAEARKQESLLSLEMLQASNSLAYSVAMALKRGHCNGEVESAVTEYQTAKEKYDRFLKEQAIRQLN